MSAEQSAPAMDESVSKFAAEIEKQRQACSEHSTPTMAESASKFAAGAEKLRQSSRDRNVHKQSVSELLVQKMGENLEGFTNSVRILGEHKQELTGIVLKDISNEDKLLELRKSILKFRITKFPELLNPEDANLVKMKMKTSFGELETDDMEQIMNYMERVAEPFKKHEKFVGSIAEIIRSKDLSTDKKIDEISNLLM